jgi:hypothetical protein
MKVKLTIEIDGTTGEIDVQGPSLPNGSFNLGLCYSMLELARDVMKDRSTQVQKVVGVDASDVDKFGKPH